MFEVLTREAITALKVVDIFIIPTNSLVSLYDSSLLPSVVPTSQSLICSLSLQISLHFPRILQKLNHKTCPFLSWLFKLCNYFEIYLCGRTYITLVHVLMLNSVLLHKRCHNLFFHSPVGGHLCCLQFGAITNESSMDFVYKSLHAHVLSCPVMSKHRGAEWPDHMVVVCFKYFGNHQTDFQTDCTILHLYQQGMKSSSSSPCSATFGIHSVFHFSLSNRCVIVSHVSVLCFPNG